MSLSARTTSRHRHSRCLNKDRLAGPRCRPDQSVDDYHRSARFEAEVHATQPPGLEQIRHLVLILGFAVEEEKAATSRSSDLAASRARGSRLAVPLIDPGIADATCQLALRHPRPMQPIADRVDVAPS